MPTKTPNQNSGGYDTKGYDDGAPSEFDDKQVIDSGADPRTNFEAHHQFAANKSSDPRGGTPENDGKAEGRSSLLDKETSAGGTSGASSSIESREERLLAAEKRGGFSKLLSGGSEEGAESESIITPKKVFLRYGKRRTAAIVAAVMGGVLGIIAIIVIAGPFQTIHMAQQFMKHLRSNEDFGNDRTSKLLTNALRKDKERGRLGITTNVAADLWEKKLSANNGMKPVYQMPSGRFIGFEITDRNKAGQLLGDLEGGTNRQSKKIQQSMGNGAKLSSGEGREIRSTNGTRLGANSLFVDLTDVSASDRRTWIKTISKSTGTNKLASALGSRLLIKRAGVNFHPLNKLKNDRDDRREKKLIEKRANEIENGVESSGGPTAGTSGTDEDGNATVDAADESASDDTKDIIEKFKTGGFKSVGRASPDAVIGVLCSARQFGEGIEDYKYANNVLPMIRMGMNVITTGNQVMSGKDVSLENLRILNQFMYDKENKTSWTEAESVRAENGKQGGVAMPKEADLRDEGTTGKPKLFNTIDGIPALKTTCSVQEGFFNLPIIKQVVGGIGVITEQLAKAALSLVGTSPDQLLESALKAIAGKSVDPNSKGAAFGNLANAGAFLAANDQAISMGGKALTKNERARLAVYNNESTKIDESQKSIASRYLDPYSQTSIVGSIIDSTPTNSSQAASMVSNPVNSIVTSFSHLFSSFNPKVSAQVNEPYDYGVAQYAFSVSERQSDLFEDPYDNGQRKNDEGVTLEDDLPRLNAKYGECFGMTVTTDDKGVHVKTGKTVNTFKQTKDNYKANPDCDPSKGKTVTKSDTSKEGIYTAATTTTTASAELDRYNQYRFYLADAVTAVSLACDAGNEESCTELGIGTAKSANDPDDSAGSENQASEKVDVDKIREPSDKIDCANGTKDLGVGDGYTQGKKVKIRLCAVSNIKSSGEESNNGYGVSGAGGKAVVNSRVSGAFYALGEAAKKEGIDVSANSSFRSMAHQQALCTGGCASGDYTFVAKPGTSNHQLGVAIDFNHNGKGGNADNCDGGRGSDPCTLKSDPTWQWLTKNADKYDMKQYSKEFWHWSPLGK